MTAEHQPTDEQSQTVELQIITNPELSPELGRRALRPVPEVVEWGPAHNREDYVLPIETPDELSYSA